MTLQMLLDACESNTHPSSSELRRQLAADIDADAKYGVLVQYFCGKGIEDLRSWNVDASVDLLLLRNAMSEPAKTMLSQFNPADMLKILFKPL